MLKRKSIHHFEPQLIGKQLTLPLFRLKLAVTIFFFLIVIGTCGYHLVEHWGFLDSLFMAVITLAAVGFGEIHRLDSSGEIFTIFLILFGVGVMGWAFFTMFEVLSSETGLRDLEHHRTRRMVKKMKNHYIVCGYGRIGSAIVRGYQRYGAPYVVIEHDSSRLEYLRNEGIPHLEGDPSSDEMLIEAGIDRAKALISVYPTDAANTFIVLSARGLNPSLMIVSRADFPAAVAKLYRAGANKVVSHHALGGWWMAAAAVNPATTDFMEGISLADRHKTMMYEFSVGGALDGVTFKEAQFREITGALIVSVRRDNEFQANPSDDFLLRKGDALIAIGAPKQLVSLGAICDPESPVLTDLPYDLSDPAT
jgi:voltage-gated potassium channel